MIRGYAWRWAAAAAGLVASCLLAALSAAYALLYSGARPPSPVLAPPCLAQAPCFLLSSQAQVVSCEMIEAVGHEHLQAYFRILGAMVRPGGKVVIQVSPREVEGRVQARVGGGGGHGTMGAHAPTRQHRWSQRSAARPVQSAFALSRTGCARHSLAAALGGAPAALDRWLHPAPPCLPCLPLPASAAPASACCR